MQHLNAFLIKYLISGILFVPQDSIKSFTFSTPPVSYSVDLQHCLYIGFEDGALIKYNTVDGQQLHYSFPNQSAISLIEAQNHLKTFLFYFDTQQIMILDRFNTIPKIYSLSSFGVDIAMMACPSPEEYFWIVENNPHRIKKIDPRKQTTLLEVQTELGDSIRFMRTYKNLLLILDENSLHTFDLFGSKIHSIPNLNADYFQVVQDHLMLKSDDNLLFIDPFKREVIDKVPIANWQDATVIIQLHNKKAIIKEDELLISR